MKKTVCLILALILSLSVLCMTASAEEMDILILSPDKMPETGSFSDVTTADWFFESVEKAAELGLMEGKADGCFKPYDELTRAELVTILWRLAGEPEVTPEKDFADFYFQGVDPMPEWSETAFLWACHNGIVTGYENKMLRAEEPVSRQQTAVLLYRFAQYMGETTEASGELDGVADAALVAGYALPAVTWAYTNGIMEGYADSLLPCAFTTRAAAAALLVRFAEKYAG